MLGNLQFKKGMDNEYHSSDFNVYGLSDEWWRIRSVADRPVTSYHEQDISSIQSDKEGTKKNYDTADDYSIVIIDADETN